MFQKLGWLITVIGVDQDGDGKGEPVLVYKNQMSERSIQYQQFRTVMSLTKLNLDCNGNVRPIQKKDGRFQQLMVL